MIGVYFSGTGNTKHCVSTFVNLIDKHAVLIPLESKECKNFISNEKDTIVFGYPTQYSNAPVFVRNFILNNKDIFKEKNIFIITTMGMFSGDGAGCSARLFKKAQANILGGLHVVMPDNICDVKLLKKSVEGNKDIIDKADKKVKRSAYAYKNGHPTQDGLSLWSHIAGLFGQRLWFYYMTKDYSNRLKIDIDKCIRCGKCVSVCPMENLDMDYNKVVSKSKCTMCYRCVSKCPEKAITLIGKKVGNQYRFEKLEKELLKQNK